MPVDVPFVDHTLGTQEMRLSASSMLTSPQVGNDSRVVSCTPCKKDSGRRCEASITREAELSPAMQQLEAGSSPLLPADKVSSILNMISGDHGLFGGMAAAADLMYEEAEWGESPMRRPPSADSPLGGKWVSPAVASGKREENP